MSDCQHIMSTLVETDFSTWPATETYACDACGHRWSQPWEGDDDGGDDA
jgi:DNA-directed RNA polymerase subunit M/transcription elongation factor TFIIS